MKLKIFSKRDILSLLTLKKPQNTSQTFFSLLFDCLDDINDVPYYEFADFCISFKPFLESFEQDSLIEDFQLMKRMNNRLFSRIKGRFPELQGHLYDLKVKFVERAVE